jgi:H+/Cl- antiporter ClcA
MHNEGKQMISIWIFIGVLLIAYGFLIMGQGMWELFVPPAKPVVLVELHAGLWWGALVLILGGVFVGANSKW